MTAIAAGHAFSRRRLTPHELPSILNLMMTCRKPLVLNICLLLSLSFLMGSCRESRQVDRILKRLDIKYEMDSEGDYRAFLPGADGNDVVVGLTAHAVYDGTEVGFRDIWSVAGRLPVPLHDDLAKNLLRDNWTSRHFGAWANAGTTSDDKQVLVYVVRIPADSSRAVYLAAINAAAGKASDMQAALSDIQVVR
jgi:hypothetical protein